MTAHTHKNYYTLFLALFITFASLPNAIFAQTIPIFHDGSGWNQAIEDHLKRILPSHLNIQSLGNGSSAQMARSAQNSPLLIILDERSAFHSSSLPADAPTIIYHLPQSRDANIHKSGIKLSHRVAFDEALREIAHIRSANDFLIIFTEESQRNVIRTASRLRAHGHNVNTLPFHQTSGIKTAEIIQEMRDKNTILCIVGDNQLDSYFNRHSNLQRHIEVHANAIVALREESLKPFARTTPAFTITDDAEFRAAIIAGEISRALAGIGVGSSRVVDHHRINQITAGGARELPSTQKTTMLRTVSALASRIPNQQVTAVAQAAQPDAEQKVATRTESTPAPQRVETARAPERSTQTRAPQQPQQRRVASTPKRAAPEERRATPTKEEPPVVASKTEKVEVIVEERAEASEEKTIVTTTVTSEYANIFTDIKPELKLMGVARRGERYPVLDTTDEFLKVQAWGNTGYLRLSDTEQPLPGDREDPKDTLLIVNHLIQILSAILLILVAILIREKRKQRRRLHKSGQRALLLSTGGKLNSILAEDGSHIPFKKFMLETDTKLKVIKNDNLFKDELTRHMPDVIIIDATLKDSIHQAVQDVLNSYRLSGITTVLLYNAPKSLKSNPPIYGESSVYVCSGLPKEKYLRGVLQKKNSNAKKSKPAESNLSGLLSDTSAADILQLLGSLKKTGALVVDDESIFSAVFFSNGKIIHAKDRYGEIGRSALFKTLNKKDGQFHFIADRTPKEQSIDSEVMALLMEWSAYCDETQTTSCN